MSASFFTILGCKTLQALSFCVKIEVTEIEVEDLYRAAAIYAEAIYELIK